MAEIADDLVPTDGLTNSYIRFAGLDAVPAGGAAILRFDIHDEDKRLVGTFSFPVSAQPDGTVDSMMAEGHRQMRNVLRQWLYGMDLSYRAYEERKAR